MTDSQVQVQVNDTAPSAPAKPGYKTSEFWLSLAAALLGAALTAGLFPDTSPWAKILGVFASVLSALGYTVSRSIVKK